MPDPAPYAAAVKGQRELSGVENLRELRLALDVATHVAMLEHRMSALTADLERARA
jgi:hypothetical protein